MILNVVVSCPIVDVLYTSYLDDSECAFVSSKFCFVSSILDDYVFLLNV